MSELLKIKIAPMACFILYLFDRDRFVGLRLKSVCLVLRNISETENTSRKLPLPTPRKFRLGHLQTKVRQVKELISNSCRGSKSISRSLRWLGFCCCLFVLFLFLHNCLDQETLEPLRRHTDDITGFLAPWTLPFF